MVENSSEQFNTDDVKEKDWGNFLMVSHFVGHLLMISRLGVERDKSTKYSDETLEKCKTSLQQFTDKVDDAELIEKLEVLSDKLNQISPQDNVNLGFVDEIHQALRDVENIVLQKGIE